MKVSEFRKKIRSMKLLSEEFEIGDIVIKRHLGNYGIRQRNDEPDLSIDYNPYLFGFTESWLIDYLKRKSYLYD